MIKYIYIYIYRERERERDTHTKKDNKKRIDGHVSVASG